MKSIARSQELKFLALILALVVSLGAGSVLNIARTPQVVAKVPSVETNRVPASVPTTTEQEKPDSALGNIETLDWTCGDAVKNIQSTSHRLRIKGRSCAGDNLSVVNETNGLTATVFIGEKSFSTEYMQLDLGKNEIAVNWTDKKGQAKSTKIIVLRN